MTTTQLLWLLLKIAAAIGLTLLIVILIALTIAVIAALAKTFARRGKTPTMQDLQPQPGAVEEQFTANPYFNR